MNTNEIKAGIYRLTEDCPAHAPDKRVKHDWRAAPMKAGTMFAVRSYHDGHLEIATLHGYTHDCIRVELAKFLDKLERVTSPTATQHLAFLHGASYWPGAAGAILDRLMEQGLLTTAAIDRMLSEIDAKSKYEVEP